MYKAGYSTHDPRSYMRAVAGNSCLNLTLRDDPSFVLTMLLVEFSTVDPRGLLLSKPGLRRPHLLAL
jgi:hypothetical protein